jgi:hypothetical protein
MKGMFFFDDDKKQSRWFTLLWVFGILSANAQLSQPHRYEIEHKFSERNYNIVCLNKDGLAVIRDNDKYEEGKKLWDLAILDSTLQKKWEGKLSVSNRSNFIGHEYANGQLFLLFKEGETNATSLQLLIFSLSDNQYATYEIKHQVDFRLTHFTVCESTVVLGGYIAREPMVLLYAVPEKQLKVVPGFFLKDVELLDLRVNRNSTFNILMVERKSADEKKLILRTYDETGTLLVEDLMPIDRDKTLLTGITSSLVHDEMIVIGTYGDGTTKQSRGFYSSIVDPFSNQPVNYTDLTQFEHFVDYLGTKRANRVKENGEQQRQRGKPAQFKNNISLIRIHEGDKGFFLLAEAYDATSGISASNRGFSPYYSTPATSYPYGGYYSPYYSSPYSSNNQQNSLVKMLQSVTILFNKSGKVDWDEGFKFDDVKYYGLEQASDFIAQSNGFMMAYKKKSDILTKKAFLYEKEAVLDTTKIKTLSEDDVIRSESEGDGGLRYWYDNYFYSWGYQTLRNHSKNTDAPTRHVFYINKIKTG